MHVVGTAGHVDHGKSTLVRALTGIDPDRFEEEKRRGLTIDLGFAWRTLPSGREIGIVDVPGHERFIRNMLAGAGGIDVALFVVAADEGWMPQSAEHLLVLDFLEVASGVVALTKSDLVGAEELDVARTEISERMKGTRLEGAAIVPVSATTGDGLDALVAALDELLGRTPGAEDRGRPRMFVDRSFTIAGAGTVVTGTLVGGSLHVGQTAHVLPNGAQARVRSLQTHERSVDTAVPGSRVAANLVGLERVDVVRGDVLTGSDEWLTTDTFAARIEAASSLDHPFTERGAYELYVGSAELACRIKFLEDRSDAIVVVSSDDGVAAGIRPGAELLVQMFCERTLPVVPGDRFVIRDVGRGATVAGGVVLDTRPGAIRRGDEDRLARLRSRVGLSPAELARRIVVERGVAHAALLVAEAGISGAELARVATGWDDVMIVDELYVDAAHLDALKTQALAVIAEHHRVNPLVRGMPKDALLRELGQSDDLSPLLTALTSDGMVVQDGNTVRLPTHGSALSASDREAADRVLHRLRTEGMSPPTLPDLGVPIALAKAMERSGELVLVGPAIAYPADVWDDIERRVAGLIDRNGSVTVSQVREEIGTTRKYAVPMLEKLDATGVTRRSGDARSLGPRGRELLSEA